ncbi:hypothetical protein MDOR_24970 [Mycolicibacterium doricum]|uniref:Uncharacterized protein n=1 Tax=Mycolicibacterium doricum TaxID=126673 RepID=A0A7I7VXR9_9MYCO|nr:hypothetical protein MDOR_24970 [Mycolicibacterium doricum]
MRVLQADPDTPSTCLIPPSVAITGALGARLAERLGTVVQRIRDGGGKVSTCDQADGTEKNHRPHAEARGRAGGTAASRSRV